MKRASLWALVLVILSCSSVLAEEMPQNRLTIELLFPQKSTSPMSAPKPKLEPQEVSGIVFIEVQPISVKIEEESPLIEFFLDGQLLKQDSSFAYTLDTTKYANGQHRLIVNFWDKSGPSAIGIREIFINNPENKHE